MIPFQARELLKQAGYLLDEPVTCVCQLPSIICLPYTSEYKHWFCCPH